MLSPDPISEVISAVPELAEHLLRSTLGLCGYKRRTIKTSVGRVHVLDAEGQGHLPPTVLLHGLGSAGVHYAPLLRGLRGHVSRLILPDLPAHGFSDSPPHGALPSALLAGLTDALDEVLDEPAMLFGNSLGGAMAVRYALARPGRVRGLVLSSPAGAFAHEAELQQIVNQFRMPTHAAALAFVDRLFARPHPLRHFVALHVRRRFTKTPLDALVGALSPCDLLTPEQLRGLHVPVRLLWGTGDRILPASHLAYFRRHLPANAEIEELEGVGHSPYLERPRLVVRHLLGFLRSLEAPEVVPAIRAAVA
jgi:pimeloyl-ACP methyl ester carboxylesterase